MGSAEPTTDLHAVFEELRQLREESRLRQEREIEFLFQLRQRDEAVQRLQEQINQLSRSDNILFPAINSSVGGRTCFELGYKLKPDTYDGSVPLRDFLTQFDLISCFNGWGDSTKAVALASCLRRKASRWNHRKCVSDVF